MHKNIVLSAAVLLGACALSPAAVNEVAEPALKKQAAFDFNCPAETLSTMETGKYRYGVQGCGKRASYLMQACNMMTKECTFVLNGAISTDAPAAPAATK